MPSRTYDEKNKASYIRIVISNSICMIRDLPEVVDYLGPFPLKNTDDLLQGHLGYKRSTPRGSHSYLTISHSYLISKSGVSSITRKLQQVNTTSFDYHVYNTSRSNKAAHRQVKNMDFGQLS